MIFYGLADYRMTGSELGQVIEFYPFREEAELALREVSSPTNLVGTVRSASSKST